MDKVKIDRVNMMMEVKCIISVKGVKRGVVWLSDEVCRVVKLDEGGIYWRG